DEARSVVDEGLTLAQQAGDRSSELQMTLRAVFLDEAAGRLREAAQGASEAAALAQGLQIDLEWLSACVALLRIVRKVHESGELSLTEESARASSRLVDVRKLNARLGDMRNRALELVRSQPVRSALQSRPALLQEAAAELGEHDVALLVDAVSHVGITPEDFLALRSEVASGAARSLSDREHKRLGDLLGMRSSRGAGQIAAELVPAFTPFFIRRIRQAVEDSLRRTMPDRSGAGTQQSSGGLSARERVMLETWVLRSFDKSEIDVLALDSFDVSLD